MTVDAENSKRTAAAIGRPFPKGKSGNPGGRPKAEGDIRELARACGPDAIELLSAMMRDTSTAARVRVAAAVAILDRGYGRPAQTTSLTIDAPPRRAENLSDDELLAIIAGGSDVRMET